MELFRHNGDLLTYLLSYGRTELFLKSLSRLKRETRRGIKEKERDLIGTRERERDKRNTREKSTST